MKNFIIVFLIIGGLFIAVTPLLFPKQAKCYDDCVGRVCRQTIDCPGSCVCRKSPDSPYGVCQ